MSVYVRLDNATNKMHFIKNILEIYYLKRVESISIWFVDNRVTLSILVFFWDLPGDDDAEDLEEGDADADPGDEVGVALDERLDLGQPSFLVDVIGRSLRATLEVDLAGCTLVTGLWDAIEGGVIPVVLAVDAAAPQVVLGRVPGDGNAVVIRLCEVLHGLIHLLHDLPLGAAGVHGQHVDGTSDLSNDNDGEECGEGFEHAGVPLRSTAATEEAQDEEDDAADDEQDGTVGITLVEELQELNIHLGVDVDA